MTVLILAPSIEPQVDRVVVELAERDVPVFRTDLAEFPQRLTISARLGEHGWEGTLANPHRSVDLAAIRSIWYRHPSQFDLPAGLSRPELRHAAAEARVGVAGVLSGLDALWMNYPARESDAMKPRQLAVARRCGLAVPESLITNRAADVPGFASAMGGTVAGKNLTGAAIVESGRIQTAYTRRLGPADLADLSGVETTAHLFQQFIDDKDYEVRAIVIGSQIYCAALHPGSAAARIDYRSDYPSVTYSLVEPPDHVRRGLLAFMTAFDLTFGAFDLAVTTTGEWIMYECNPFGAYGWIEDELELPLTAGIADVLQAGTTATGPAPAGPS